MKYFRFILILCVMAFLSNDYLAAASKPERGAIVTSKSAPVLDSLYSQSYAVIIGVNGYDKWPSLEYAVKDARAMEEKLKLLGFQTTVLIDQHATKDNILKILGDELPQKVQKNDRVIIFFAGHGQTEEMADGTQMGYIVPVDADTRNIFSTAISMDQVRVFSRRLRAKHVLYLIDSCYAGLGLTRSGSIPPTERDYLRKITTRKAHQMLTAGGKGELAHEEGGHGVFTKYVLEALDGAADRDEKGFITFSDMASYVKPKVSRYTGTKQVPQYGSIDGEGEFVFVLGGLPPAQQANSSSLDQDRRRLDEEKKQLEADRSSLIAQRAQMEEQRRLNEEKKHIAEERMRIQKEKEELERQNKEVRDQAEGDRGRAKERATLSMGSRPLASSSNEAGRDGRFIAYNNGTVLDKRTNLVWAAKDNGSAINWSNAKSYCENYRGGGYTDWRMPTQDELAGLYDAGKLNGQEYRITALIEITSCCLWTAETRGSDAAYINFTVGERYMNPQSLDILLRALPVRAAK